MQLSDYSMMTHTKNLCRLLPPVKVQSVTIHEKVVLLRVGITGVKNSQCQCPFLQFVLLAVILLPIHSSELLKSSPCIYSLSNWSY